MSVWTGTRVPQKTTAPPITSGEELTALPLMAQVWQCAAQIANQRKKGTGYPSPTPSK